MLELGLGFLWFLAHCFWHYKLTVTFQLISYHWFKGSTHVEILLQQQKHVHILHSHFSAPLCLSCNTFRSARKSMILHGFAVFIPHEGREEIVMELPYGCKGHLLL